MCKTPKKTQFDKERAYEWLIISQSYLQCALMNARILSLTDELREFNSAANSSLAFCFEKIYGDYKQECQYLVFPIIFSFKHGIELYLKAICGIKNRKFTKWHKLPNLFQDIGINDKTVEDIIEKYAYARLLLPNNTRLDEENSFERYPQNNPYDKMDVASAVTYDKIVELIGDIESLCPKIRELSRSIS